MNAHAVTGVAGARAWGPQLPAGGTSGKLSARPIDMKE